MYNILTERLIRMDKSDGSRVEISLPEVYAALMADEVDAFPALRPHHRHTWHAFLVQLGVMAMHRAGVNAPPADPTEWAEIIRGLTPAYPDDEPWQLVVDDITLPAFMQPPALSADKLSEYLYENKKGRYEPENGKKQPVYTPDELDMLVTSKNHDVKSAVASSVQVDDWIFTLISLQTGAAQDGKGNYSVSRIRSAYSARPAFSLAPCEQEGVLRWGLHVQRDISVLLERRGEVLNTRQFNDNGLALLWLCSWHGDEGELLRHVDPFYIEICRRVRLRVDNGQLLAVLANSKVPRINKTQQGRTGDPWTPVDDQGMALNVGPTGFMYKRISHFLASWNHPILLESTYTEEHSHTLLVARSLKRNTWKHGMTEGYAERVIPLNPDAMRRPGALRALGEVANDRIEDVDKVQRILSHAIQIFLGRGETDKVSREHRNLARPWLNQLDEIVDVRFFEHLQAEFKAHDRDERQRIRNNWQRDVVNRARLVLADAMDSLPCPEIERYKARVRAEGLFEGRIRGNHGLPSLFTEKGVDDDNLSTGERRINTAGTT